ncbi:MAG: HAD family hydrolase [Clostridiales bacterium]|nr:HAD family hydrolase [Clostridiales bacterium]
MKKKAIIFDMDGTLWDSVDNIVDSWNLALRQMGETDVTITRERIIGLMGKTMDQFAKALLPHYGPERGMEVMHILEEVENDYLRQHGAVLLGDAAKTFRGLRDLGFGIGIVSNCQSGYIEAFLEYYHLEALVDDIECYGNTLRGKADNLKLLIERNGLEQYWYLGDTQGDYDACREAEVPFVWAAYGFGEVSAACGSGDVSRDDGCRTSEYRSPAACGSGGVPAEIPRVDALEEIVLWARGV